MQSLLILGRQPALGLAELESLYGASSVRRVGDTALLDVDPCLLAFDRLGGSIKFCKVLTIIDSATWPEVLRFLTKVAPNQAMQMPKGKMHVGLSLHGFNLSNAKIMASGLTLKKAISKTGRSVRLVPNQAATLSSAQVIHNKLFTENGWELVLVKDGRQTIIAQTVKVQDITSYALRDRGRPKRDARVGMLPPKLGQIIINLATGKLPPEKLQSICEIPAGSKIPRPKFSQTILDPFCGTGVLLQEALLMGYDVYGSDIEPRMIDFSRTNLAWLHDSFRLEPTKEILEVGDASNHTWQKSIDLVAGEAYLGKPFTSRPDDKTLNKNASDCNLILSRCLKNLSDQLPPGTRVCLALPAWQIAPGKFLRLPLLDQIASLGYNQVSLGHVRVDDLIYYRNDQFVARQLLVLKRM